jgi:molybdate transport system substrate-binding protein
VPLWTSSSWLLVPGSLAGFAVSSIAAAVRAGDAVPDLSDAAAVKRAVLAAGRVGYSTGPSGDHLLGLLDKWAVRAELADRLIQAPPGVPVGRMLAEGAVDLAVQQRSELMGVPGIVIAGDLPADAQSKTLFTAGITRTSARPGIARDFIAFLAAADMADVKRRHGLEPT